VVPAAKAVACFTADDLDGVEDSCDAATMKSCWNCAGARAEQRIREPVGHKGAGKGGEVVGLTGVAGTVVV
jgi:hypothetical protein